jgi:heat shock protein HspQ
MDSDKLLTAIKVFEEEWDGEPAETLNAKCRYLHSNQECCNETIEKAFRETFGQEDELPDYFYRYEIKFEAGHIIEHIKYSYFGVIVAVDEKCQASDEWYEHMQCEAKGVVRDQPWYHVLVHNATHTTYVAQQNLALSVSQSTVNHPWLQALFESHENGRYIRNDVPWESL